MKIQIIIEFNGKYAKENAEQEIDNVRQLFMRRNPLDEPYIYIKERIEENETKSKD